MLFRDSHGDHDVIRNSESGQIVEHLDEGDPTPEYVRENPSDPVPGEKHRAKNPQPDEIVELRGNPKYGDHGSKHGDEHGDEHGDDHGHSHNSNSDTMADRENITDNLGEDTMEVVTTSGSALAGEMVASELSSLVNTSLLAEQSATIRKTASVAVPFTGALLTLNNLGDRDWGQAAAVGMALAGIRNGLKWVLPNSSPVDVGESASADLQGRAGTRSLRGRTGTRSIANAGTRTRALQGRTVAQGGGRTYQQQATRQQATRQATRQSQRGVSGGFSSEMSGGGSGTEEMEGIA